jgi:hypothetical protein
MNCERRYAQTLETLSIRAHELMGDIEGDDEGKGGGEEGEASEEEIGG